MDGSLNVWQYISMGIIAGKKPFVASIKVFSNSEKDSCTWKVPANAKRGSMPDLSCGKRFKRIFIFICEPSRLTGGFVPRNCAKVCGAAFDKR